MQTNLAMVAYGALFLFWIISSVAYGAATYAVADVYLGRGSTIRDAYARIRGRLWRVMALTFNVVIRVFGLLFFIVLGCAIVGIVVAAVLSRSAPAPGTFGVLFIVLLVVLGFGLALWFSLRYAVSMPAMLLEDIKGRAAIRRSVQLGRGRRGHLFIAVLLSIVLSYTAAFVFQGPFYLAIALMGIKGELPTWMALALSISATMGGALTGPLLMIVLVLCYYDLRIRKEGFDLQFMMTSLPDTKPAGSASPA